MRQELAGRGYFLSSANSINWGRILPQVVYYVSAYCDLLNMGEIRLGDKVNYCVPTGNFGVTKNTMLKMSFAPSTCSTTG